MNVAFIPSPSDGVWHLGPLPLRAYALAIILGIVVAIWVGERRFVARGGRAGQVSDVAVWAIPFGLVGARVYHVATNPEFYFGDGKDPIQALYVWEGGLGIWGAIGFGALGAYLGCRFSGIRYTSFLDAVAPGVVLAQAIGRWGNYFNQELFGKPTDQPWGLEISVDNRPEGYLDDATFHPTFLYESLWCIGVAIIIVLADRRYKLGRGRVFALYVALYTAGRAWIENLRIDDAHEFGGLRLNVWVALGMFVLAVAYFIIVGRRRPGREESVYREGREPTTDADRAAEADQKDRVEAKVGAGAAAASGATAAAGTTVEADAEPESGTTPESETRAMPAVKPEPDAKAETETDLASTGEADDQPESEVKPETPEAESEVKAEAETAEATPEAEPEVQAEAEPESEAQPEPEAEPETQAEAEPAEAKPEAEPEVQAETEPESEAQPVPEAESESKAETAEVKPESESEATAEATPEAESEATPEAESEAATAETAELKPESSDAEVESAGETDADAAAADSGQSDVTETDASPADQAKADEPSDEATKPSSNTPD